MNDIPGAVRLMLEKYLSENPSVLHDDKRAYTIDTYAKLEFFITRGDIYGYGKTHKASVIYIKGDWKAEFDKEFPPKRKA